MAESDSGIPWSLILLVGLGAAGWHYRARLPFFGSRVSISGGNVTKTVEGIDFNFAKGEAFSDSYFLFGAMPKARSEPHDMVVAALPSARARDLYQRFPDFYRCASGGSDEGKEKSIFFRVLPANGSVASVLSELPGKLDASQGADRIALKMSGSMLSLTSIKDAKDGEDFTKQFVEAMDANQKYETEYVLVDSLEIIPGKEMLDGH